MSVFNEEEERAGVELFELWVIQYVPAGSSRDTGQRKYKAK